MEPDQRARLELDTGAHESRDAKRRSHIRRRLAETTVGRPRGAFAIGALAGGALALGALAIGSVAVGVLAIGTSRIRKLRIEELEVKRLRVGELDIVGGPVTPPIRPDHVAQ